MKVFKFGGASVKNAEAVKNVAHILKHFVGEPLLVVVSAMGKTTNALERLTEAYVTKDEKQKQDILIEIKRFHDEVISGLLSGKGSHTYDDIDNLFIELECLLETPVEGNYDYNYDQIVSFGEVFSTRIVSTYLKEAGISNRWIDARNFIQTDGTYREGRVDWNTTADIISKKLKPIALKQLIVTQGFIAQSPDKQTVTLGREGSDYSAAIFAYGLDAESVSIWKDVSGVMNADPKRLQKAVKVDGLNYNTAIELAYYGATVIHPKTIQPLKSKNIPLYVRSFLNINEKGTEVSTSQKEDTSLPFYIFKDQQTLISLSTRDFSFIIENHLKEIFTILNEYGFRVNLMQNSAISFSFVVNDKPQKMQALIDRLSEDFQVAVVHNCQMLTVRNPEKAQLSELISGKTVAMEQRGSNVWQLVLEA
ncbi:MAG: aspartate kinase [Bacteroidetes bacterium]|nr:MAG: aspartate kinase [Bacteroidota bacterium]